LLATDTAMQAAKALPDSGKAIRIAVQTTDADLARAVLDRYGAEYKESGKAGRTVFVIANREGLSREEHPYALAMLRELTQRLTPIAVNLP